MPVQTADNFNDTVTSGSFGITPGDDTIYGSTGNDFIDGGNGRDTVDYGSNSLFGLPGLAGGITLKPLGVVEKVVGGIHYTDTLRNIEVISGNAAFVNTIDSSTATGNAFINVNLSTNSLFVGGLPSPLNSLSFTVNNFRNVYGTNNSDTIVGDRQNNTLAGNGGNDVISGGAGNDFISGGTGNDSLTGDAGNDTIHGGDGNDTLNGTNSHSRGFREIDFLEGGSGFDNYVIGDRRGFFYVGNGNNDFVTIRDNFRQGVAVQLGSGSYETIGTQLFALVGGGKDLVANFVNAPNPVVHKVQSFQIEGIDVQRQDIAADAIVSGDILQGKFSGDVDSLSYKSDFLVSSVDVLATKNDLSVGAVDLNADFSFIPQGAFTLSAGQSFGIFTAAPLDSSSGQKELLQAATF